MSETYEQAAKRVKREIDLEAEVRKRDAYDLVDWIKDLEDRIAELEAERDSIRDEARGKWCARL